MHKNFLKTTALVLSLSMVTPSVGVMANNSSDTNNVTYLTQTPDEGEKPEDSVQTPSEGEKPEEGTQTPSEGEKPEDNIQTPSDGEKPDTPDDKEDVQTPSDGENPNNPGDKEEPGSGNEGDKEEPGTGNEGDEGEKPGTGGNEGNEEEPETGGNEGSGDSGDTSKEPTKPEGDKPNTGGTPVNPNAGNSSVKPGTPSTETNNTTKPIVENVVSNPDGTITVIKDGAIDKTVISGLKVVPSVVKVKYDGKAKTPAIKIVDAKGRVVSSSDYTITYSNNKNIGNATITVHFKDKNVTKLTGQFAIEVSKGYKATVGKFNYKVTSGSTVSLTSMKNKNAKTVNVPATVKIGGKKFKVTEVSANAFKGYKQLKKITLSTNITKIGKNAFLNSSKLKSIIIKSTKVKSVGKNAFKGINKSIKIKVPKNKLKAYKKVFSSVKNKVVK